MSTRDDRLLDVWINCPDDETARQIGAALVERRLAACVNVLPPIWSQYRWEGAVEHASEAPLVAKTRDGCFDALCTAVRELHPYDVPSILGLPIDRVDPNYAAWIATETADPA